VVRFNLLLSAMITSGSRERAVNPMEVSPGNSVEIKPKELRNTGVLIYYLHEMSITCISSDHAVLISNESLRDYYRPMI
jgi:hypothetical protein